MQIQSLNAFGCVLPRSRSRVIHRYRFYNYEVIETIGFELRLVFINMNDPSAGSPTDTVLRLLHPLDDKAQGTSKDTYPLASKHLVHPLCRIIQSVEATGGVYKGQGHNQHKVMTCPY
jgi:hypothetical protein